MQRLPPLCFPCFPPFLENSGFWDCIQVYLYAVTFFIQKPALFRKNICKSRRFLVTLPLTGGVVAAIL